MRDIIWMQEDHEALKALYLQFSQIQCSWVFSKMFFMGCLKQYFGQGSASNNLSTFWTAP